MHVRRSDIRQQTPPQPRVAEESQQPGSSRTSAAPPAPPTPYREAINRPDRFPKACGQTHSTRYHQSGASESGNPQNAFRTQWKTRNHFRIAAPNAHHTAPCIPHSPHTENHHRYPDIPNHAVSDNRTVAPSAPGWKAKGIPPHPHYSPPPAPDNPVSF